MTEDTTAEALRIAAEEAGYKFPTISFAALPEPKANITKVTSRSYNLEISDYMKDLPEMQAHQFAESVVDYITGGLGGIPEDVREYIRSKHTQRYIKRKGYLRPEDIREVNLAGIAEALKRNGQIPKDITVLWTRDPKSSHISPTFRIIAIPTYLLDDRDEGA